MHAGCTRNARVYPWFIGFINFNGKAIKRARTWFIFRSWRCPAHTHTHTPINSSHAIRRCRPKIPKGHTRTHQKFNELEQRSSHTHFWSSATIYCLREADENQSYPKISEANLKRFINYTPVCVLWYVTIIVGAHTTTSARSVRLVAACAYENHRRWQNNGFCPSVGDMPIRQY